MSSETPQNHQETTHQSIEGAIEEADLFLTFLEEQIKLGGFTAQTKIEIMPSDEQPTP